MNILQPVFIIGSPRSGTSLLRLIATSHSKIIIPPECGFIVWLHDKYGRWNVSDTVDREIRNQYLDDLYACKKFDTWELERDTLETLLLEQNPQDYASLCAAVVIAFGRKLKESPIVWGDKNNFHTDYLPLLQRIYPEARFLHIVRDGRDVACSYREVMEHRSASPYAPRLPTDIQKIAEEWSSNVLGVERHLGKLPASTRRLVRYEDLVENPQLEIMSICRWLELPFEEQMLRPHEVNGKLNLEPALTLNWKRRTLEPVSTDTVGRFQELLSVEEKARFASVAGDTLSLFGYTSQHK